MEQINKGRNENRQENLDICGGVKNDSQYRDKNEDKSSNKEGKKE